MYNRAHSNSKLIAALLLFILHCTMHKKGRLKLSDGLSYAKFRFMFNLKSKLTALCWLPVLFVASRLIVLYQSKKIT